MHCLWTSGVTNASPFLRNANNPANGGCIRRWPKEEQGPGQEEDTSTQLSANNAEVTERHYGVKLHRYRNWHRHQHYHYHFWLANKELSFKLAAQEKAHEASVGERTARGGGQSG